MNNVVFIKLSGVALMCVRIYVYITDNAMVNVMVVIYWKLSDNKARQDINRAY